MKFARLALSTLLSATLAGAALAQTSPAPVPAAPAAPEPPRSLAGDDRMLLTVFLKHDQSKTLEQINEELRRNGYYEKFPPEGIEVMSWYVVMGIGQIMTLRFPPARLREINRILEDTAWGGYRTEFFPTYDYKAAAESQRREMRAKGR